MINTKAIIENESDVEQKFVYPLLTSGLPYGLGYNEFEIRTKPNIRKFKIDKGKSEKYYFPDYIILIDGLPVLIVEAKHPNEDLDDGFREARLYANELNASFSTKINPCTKIIATNGKICKSGHWDSEEVSFEFTIEQAVSTEPVFAEFLDEYSKIKLDSVSKVLREKLRSGSKFMKPIFMLGGRVSIGETIKENSFGSNLALEYKYLFNPESKEDRKKVIENAYVESRKRLAHVSPIDRLIRSIITPSKHTSTEFKDTSKPIELIDRLKDISKVRKQICLLIGSVGSGKSTFIDFLKNQALPDEILKNTGWVSINLNDAPINPKLIYDWSTVKALESIKSQNESIDFYDIEFIKKVLSREIAAFEKGEGQLLKTDLAEYNKELFKLISNEKSNSINFLQRVIQYIYNGQGKLPIIVLDNCDKRNRDEQLLMFQVANWMRDNFNVMVFLPLRETTYDLYRNEPPLDTVIKDLVFRIDPPLLISVIQKRIQFALREIEANQEDFYYYLPNGLRIECKRSEVGNYLRCILHTLFQNQFFKKLMIGLTGRNIRKGLEIFLDFCKSGYLSEDLILKMRSAPSSIEIPNHLVTRILLRGTKRFYDEDTSKIKNVFSCDPKLEEIPDHFIRYSILQWLKDRQREHGPTKVKGYHMISGLVNDLVNIGHSESRLIKDLEDLMRYEYIISETQEHSYNPNNLISITSSGVVLLELLGNIDYLATVSEDTFFRQLESAKAIADNMTGRNVSHRLSKTNSLENADTLIKYLIEYKQKHWVNTGTVIPAVEDKISNQLNLCNDLIQRGKDRDPNFIDSELLSKTYPNGSVIDAQVAHLEDYGVFVEFGVNASGLIHVSNLYSSKETTRIKDDFEIGDWIKVEIIKFNQAHKKFDLIVSN